MCLSISGFEIDCSALNLYFLKGSLFTVTSKPHNHRYLKQSTGTVSCLIRDHLTKIKCVKNVFLAFILYKMHYLFNTVILGKIMH